MPPEIDGKPDPKPRGGARPIRPPAFVKGAGGLGSFVIEVRVRGYFRRWIRMAPIAATPTSQTSALPGSGTSVDVGGMLA